MGIVFGLVYLALLFFFVALIIRLVFDWVQMFAREWRPRGAALVAAHAVYSITDPPLKVLRRLIPPRPRRRSSACALSLTGFAGNLRSYR